MQIDQATIARIRALHRKRCFMMEQRKRADLALGSYLRLQLGWRLDLPKAEAKHICDLAGNLMAAGERILKRESNPRARQAPVPIEKAPEFLAHRDVIIAAFQSRKAFADVEESATETMDRLARTLPAWAWWSETVFKSSAVSLAVIVGEAGDLSLYANPAKLWKRMGLAVIGGVRQGGLSKNAPKEAWIEHGHCRPRRSRMWVIGDSLIKHDGPYRDVYLARKVVERAKAEAEGLRVVPAAKIPRGRLREFRSEGHIHLRAQRYMEKRLLRDLWKAWRRTAHAMYPIVCLSAADFDAAQAAAARAKYRVSPNAIMREPPLLSAVAE